MPRVVARDPAGPTTAADITDDAEPATKGERTRRRLLELAIERFGERGYRATSVSEIARAAGLTQAAPPGDIKRFNVLLVLGAIAISGVLAVTSANALVDARATGKEPSRWLPHAIKAAMGLLGIGLGAFLYMWWKTLR